MSLRGRQQGDYLQRTTGTFLGSGPIFTACFWMRLNSDRNASCGAWGLYLVATNYFLYYNASGDGTTFLWEQDGGDSIGSRNLQVGTWYFVGCARSGTGVTATLAVSRAETEHTLTTATGQTNAPAFTATSEAMLVNGLSVSGTGWLDGSMCALKLWNAALTAEELYHESCYFDPIRYANLIRWNPCDRETNGLVTEAAKDRSREIWTGGSLNHFNNIGGSVVPDEDPPIRWYRDFGVRRKGKAPAAGGGISIPVCVSNYRRRRVG